MSPKEAFTKACTALPDEQLGAAFHHFRKEAVGRLHKHAGRKVEASCLINHLGKPFEAAGILSEDGTILFENDAGNARVAAASCTTPDILAVLRRFNETFPPTL